MPIYRYTLKKILSSPSTWVIFSLTLVILGLVWGLPVLFLGVLGFTKELALAIFLTAWKLMSFTVFIGLMLIIFIGVKATQIFRDEIDDGTLLILVSKPVSRNRIWIEKWLAFQTIIISYLFLVILLDGLTLLIFGTSVVYLAFLPYMGMLFGIGLLFDLIFTSVILLMSLVLNSKATIAVSIGFAALINVFSQGIERIIEIPSEYFVVSQAVGVLHDLERKISNEDLEWFKSWNSENMGQYIPEIQNIMNQVYERSISDVNYPENYDSDREQAVLNGIKNNPNDYPEYSANEVELIVHIVNISDVFRQSKNQSYENLMASTRDSWLDNVSYSAYDTLNGLNLKISQTQLDLINKRVREKKVMRYLNIFYQLYYLWSGAWGDTNTSLYVDSWSFASQSDPLLVSFNENEDGEYQVDPSSGNHKIISFPILVSFYVLLGLVLLGTSWYVFNRRDFA